ncbi:Imm49 family immunity protein, partial [Archangium violaceum]
RASVTGPFFDAIAAGQWKLARQIAALSPTTWWKGHEYEDDFAYAFFLHTFIRQDPADAPALQGALAQYEQVLGGQSDPRLDLCKALYSKDQAAFLGAFPTLLGEYERKMQKLQSTRDYDYTYEPNRHVMIEGLALLKLAESVGFETEAEYPLCPSVARRTDYAPFKPLGFPNLQLEP